jgi:RimJ/RimL family protein N-acetyltransferase
LLFAPKLARTRTATDAIYTMIAWTFEAGYRRVEWKCDALNAPSRRAAQRLLRPGSATQRQPRRRRGDRAERRKLSHHGAVSCPRCAERGVPSDYQHEAGAFG